MERPDSLDTSDVDGAQAKQLPQRHTPHPFNTNRDIERSGPAARSSGPRCTNSLEPAYTLPSFVHHPIPDATAAPRDLLWTLPQKDWKPKQRGPAEWSDAEKYSSRHVFHKTIPARASMQVADIVGPQFRVEEPRWRKTDPLTPVYQYDGSEVESVVVRRHKYGHGLQRAEGEAYGLRTDDIKGESVFTREYPTHLLATRPGFNRTEDIDGAQANTIAHGPALWRQRDPSNTAEKQTNRVMDIEGAMADSGGNGIRMYRTRKQAAVQDAEALANPHRRSYDSYYASGQYGDTSASRSFAKSGATLKVGATPPLSKGPTPPASASATAAASARAADIASVKALS